MKRFLKNLFGTKTRTITRKNNRVKPRRAGLSLEALEDRQMLAATLTASLNVADGILRIEGTYGADQIHVRHESGRVSIDGINISIIAVDATDPVPSVARGQITTIQVAALDGNDVVVMHDTLIAGEATIPMLVHGGMGNDSIQGGWGADTVYGEAGNDTIMGGPGKDTLYGVHNPAAVQVVRDYDLKVDDAFLNFWGKNEKWLLERDVGQEVFREFYITPEGGLYEAGTYDRSTGQYATTNRLLEALDPSYYQDIRKLEGERGLYKYDFYYGIGNRDEKLFKGIGDPLSDGWYFITPVGELYRWDGKDWGVEVSTPINGTLIATLDFSYHADPFELAGASAVGPDDDVIDGQTQDDFVDGGAGNDQLRGGGANDTVVGGTGNDTLLGGSGKDSLSGGDGTDQIAGGSGHDRLSGGNDNDDLYGEAGNDTICGAQWGDAFETGNAGDTLYGGSGTDQLFGGIGGDHLVGGNDNDDLYGEAGNDTIVGAQWGDAFETGNAGDTLYGGDGTDQLFGGIGGDHLVGGNDNDDLHGEAGNDTIVGAQWGDAFETGNANDSIYGGDGTDQLYGGIGDDLIAGENDNDDIYGEDGNDMLIGCFNGWPVETGNANDTVHAGNGSDTLYGGDGHDVLIGENDNDLIFGERGNDELIGGHYHWAFEAGNANDTIYGGDGSDSLYGGDGHDLMVGENDNDFLWGDGGNDELIGCHYHWAFEAGNANDTIHGGDGSDSLYGGDGNDQMMGENDNDFLWGDGGDDLLVGAHWGNSFEAGNANDTLFGNAGKDSLWGGFGDDYLSGDRGQDFLVGDEGRDAMHGGDGYDIIYADRGDETLSGGETLSIAVPNGDSAAGANFCGPNGASRLLRAYQYWDATYPVVLGRTQDFQFDNPLDDFYALQSRLELGTVPFHMIGVMRQWRPETQMVSRTDLNQVLQLLGQGRPVIALVNSSGNMGANGRINDDGYLQYLGIVPWTLHYIVLTGFDQARQRISYMDYDGKSKEYSYTEFLARWDYRTKGAIGAFLTGTLGCKERTIIW